MSKFWDKFLNLMDEEVEGYRAVGVVVKKKTVNGKIVKDTVIVDGEEYVPKSANPNREDTK